MTRSYIREILDAIDEDTISFAGGLPNENLFPTKELKKASKKVFSNKNAFQYSKSKGLDTLRQKIADIYTEKFDFPTSKEEILITTGSQQAFDIIVKSFEIKKIYLKEPSYLGAIGAFRTLGKKLKGFSKDSDIKNFSKESLVYLMSDFANPDSKTMSKKQRENISKYLEKSESFLIEDGAYSLLSFDKNVKQPISAKYKNSFLLGSFSKIVAPGFRLGWIRADKANIDKILIAKEYLDLHTPTFTQMIMDSYLDENDLFAHIDKVKNDYKKRMEYMAKCFKKYIPEFKFSKPKGGMFIYGEFEEIDTFLLAKACLEKKVAFVPSSVFSLNNKKSYEARFNFSNANKKEIKKGVKIIKSIIDK